MSKKIIIAFSLLLASCGTGEGVNTSVPENTNSESTNTTQPENVTPEDSKTLFIDSKLATCVGVGPRECLRVRNDETKDWQLFYSSIEGFTYEPGFNYELLVTESKIENPPADSSSIKTTLVKIVKKEAVSVENLENTKWIYQNMKTDGKDTAVLANSELTLNFTDTQVSGSAGCNNFFGEYTQAGAQVSFKALASTKKACLNSELNQQESNFLKHLGQVSKATVENQALILETDSGTQLTFKSEA